MVGARPFPPYLRRYRRFLTVSLPARARRPIFFCCCKAAFRYGRKLGENGHYRVYGRTFELQNTQTANGADLRVQVYYDRTKREDRSAYQRSVDVFDFEFQHGIPLGSHKVLWGGGYRHARDDVPATLAIPFVPNLVFSFVPQARTLTWKNVFVQDEIKLSERVDLTLGMQATSGRTVEGRTVVVKRVKAAEPLAGVHILFVGKAESARLNQWIQSAQPHPVLTVTESDGALSQGSVINFVIAERRVRFEVALDSAEKGKLRLSSRLLAVAQQVRTGTP